MHLIHQISARIEACVRLFVFNTPNYVNVALLTAMRRLSPLSHAIVHVDFITNGTTSDPCAPVCCYFFFRSIFSVESSASASAYF